jgi:hypothetical protein
MAAEVTQARERSSGGAANVVRGTIRTIGGVTEEGYSPALKRAILAYEHNQRQEEREAMALYDDDGNMLNRVQGKRDHVPLRKEDVPREDLIMTHNHPSALGQTGYRGIGHSFSPDDMVLALKFKAKEMRAVTPNYTFSFKRPQGGWGTTQAAVRRAFIRAEERVVAEGQYYYERARMTDVANERYMATFWHKVNKIVAKEFGWNYSKKKG